jgi:hypothetical protein
MLSAGAATVLAGALIGAPAFGADARPFDLYSGTEHSKGNSHAYGTVEFDRRGTAFIQGWINDICPKDGHGAYLEIWATYGPKGSISGRFQPVWTVKDTTGCTEPGHKFALRTRTRGKKRINGVHFRLRECDYRPDSPYTDHLDCDGDFSTQDIDRDPR